MKMMTNLLAATFLAGFVGAVHAVPVALTDPITLSQSVVVHSTAQSFTYDLTDFGFDFTLHSLDSAVLSLVFAVSGQNANQISNANASIVTIGLPGQDPFSASVSSFNSMSSLFQISAEALDFESGILNFTLSRSPAVGSVVLTETTLTVAAGVAAAPLDDGVGVTLLSVPEPGTLALLGLGMLGAIQIRRRAA
jgi:hypothetical protein